MTYDIRNPVVLYSCNPAVAVIRSDIGSVVGYLTKYLPIIWTRAVECQPLSVIEEFSIDRQVRADGAPQQYILLPISTEYYGV